MSKATVLGFCLSDRTVRHVWHGPGLVRVADGVSIDRLPLWPDRKAAGAAAAAIGKALGLELFPCPVRACA